MNRQYECISRRNLLLKRVTIHGQYISLYPPIFHHHSIDYPNMARTLTTSFVSSLRDPKNTEIKFGLLKSFQFSSLLLRHPVHNHPSFLLRPITKTVAVSLFMLLQSTRIDQLHAVIIFCSTSNCIIQIIIRSYVYILI